MAKKKVIGEDGKTYVMKEKKPIYKRVWFWILAVMILVAFASSLGRGDESASGGETIDNSSQSEKKTGIRRENRKINRYNRIYGGRNKRSRYDKKRNA